VSHFVNGIRKTKKKIEIHAPVEWCYQTWINYSQFPVFMTRVLGVQSEVKPLEETRSKALHLSKDIIPADVIDHWFFSGPGGKLYETESKMILDIPNLFYCRVSTDPNDVASQTSMLFSPDENNQITVVEFEVSFWSSATLKAGKSTQLISDIVNQEDHIIEDCLQDFKNYVEKQFQESRQKSSATKNGRACKSNRPFHSIKGPR
jgi:uncharacterized membrane protein